MKNKMILLRAGETRAAAMPAHKGTTAGYYTFAVSGLDMDYPTVWSVIGARSSEVRKDDPNKIGTNKCVVHIPDDQGHEDKVARVINVSVIGTDAATKQHVETKATLTMSIFTQEDETDFSFTVHAPEEVVYTEGSEVLAPAKVEVKAHLSENVTTVEERPNFTATCVFDIQGAIKSVVLPMTVMAGSAAVFHVDVTKLLKDAADDMDYPSAYLEATYEVEIHKHHLVQDNRESYYNVKGGKLILKRTPRA